MTPEDKLTKEMQEVHEKRLAKIIANYYEPGETPDTVPPEETSESNNGI